MLQHDAGRARYSPNGPVIRPLLFPFPLTRPPCPFHPLPIHTTVFLVLLCMIDGPMRAWCVSFPQVQGAACLACPGAWPSCSSAHWDHTWRRQQLPVWTAAATMSEAARAPTVGAEAPEGREVPAWPWTALVAAAGALASSKGPVTTL